MRLAAFFFVKVLEQFDPPFWQRLLRYGFMARAPHLSHLA